MSIILLGDSLSKGIVFDEKRERFALTAQSFLHRFSPQLKLPVINVSKMGCTLPDAQKALWQRLSSEQTPDAVVIELGGNDCELNWEEVAQAPQEPHSANTPLDEFERGLRETIGQLRERGIRPFLMNLPPLDAQRYFNQFCARTEEMGKRVLEYLGDVSHIYWWHERYSSAIGVVAEQTGTPLIDIRRAFLRQEDYRAFICKDGVHPNEAGHALIAERLREFVTQNYREWLFMG